MSDLLVLIEIQIYMLIILLKDTLANEDQRNTEMAKEQIVEKKR